MDDEFSGLLDMVSECDAARDERLRPAIEAHKRLKAWCDQSNAYRKVMDRALYGSDEVSLARHNGTDESPAFLQWASFIREAVTEIIRRDDDFWLYQWQAETDASENPRLAAAYKILREACLGAKDGEIATMLSKLDALGGLHMNLMHIFERVWATASGTSPDRNNAPPKWTTPIDGGLSGLHRLLGGAEGMSERNLHQMKKVGKLLEKDRSFCFTEPEKSRLALKSVRDSLKK